MRFTTKIKAHCIPLGKLTQNVTGQHNTVPRRMKSTWLPMYKNPQLVYYQEKQPGFPLSSRNFPFEPSGICTCVNCIWNCINCKVQMVTLEFPHLPHPWVPLEQFLETSAIGATCTLHPPTPHPPPLLHQRVILLEVFGEKENTVHWFFSLTFSICI